jgi:hypothetical protein
MHIMYVSSPADSQRIWLAVRSTPTAICTARKHVCSPQRCVSYTILRMYVLFRRSRIAEIIGSVQIHLYILTYTTDLDYVTVETKRIFVLQ